MAICHSCYRKPCECADANGPRKPYDDADTCDHDYDEDEDTAEFICMHCGHREPMDLTDLIR